MSDSDEILNIKKEIEKSGLPLEIEVSSILQEKGWEVSHQSYYLDPDENKPRFFDIAALRIRTSPSKTDAVGQILLIECKRSHDKPWVFYTVPKPKYNLYIDPSRHVKFLAYPKLSLERQNSLFRHNHYFLEDPKEIATIHFEPFISRKEGKIFTAVNQILKATRYEIREELIPRLRELSQARPLIMFFYPIIVFDGRMYKCEKLGENLELSPINYIQYSVNYRGIKKEFEETYLIDVLKKEFLINYIQLLDDELNKIDVELF